MLRRRAHDVPRLGEVEDDPFRSDLGHHGLHLPDPQFELRRDLAEEALDVALCLACVVFASLHGDHPPLLPHCTGECHRQRPRAGARLEDRHAGGYVGVDEDRTDVLRVDDLGAAAHPQDEVGQSGTQGEEAVAR